jgi:hypothetical protein
MAENENLNAALQFEGTLNGIENALRGNKKIYDIELKKDRTIQTTRLSDNAISEIMSLLRSVLSTNTILSNVNSAYVEGKTFDIWYATYMCLNAELFAGRINLEDRELICETVSHATHSALLRALDGKEREFFFRSQQTQIHLSSSGAQSYQPSQVK